MTEPVYLCPDCGFNELEIKNAGLKGPDGGSLSRSRCPNCGWEGPTAQTVGVATTERLWNSKAIGDLMIRLVSKHAAGPMVQAYEFIGLLPKKRYLEEGQELTDELKAEIDAHNNLAQACRNHVMKAVFAAAVEAGFTAAEEAHRFYATETNTPLHHVLRENDTPEREFGGDVVDIKAKRK